MSNEYASYFVNFNAIAYSVFLQYVWLNFKPISLFSFCCLRTGKSRVAIKRFPYSPMHSVIPRPAVCIVPYFYAGTTHHTFKSLKNNQYSILNRV